MKEDVIFKLAFLGYAFLDSDDWALDFVIEKITNRIKNECNIVEIPNGLRQVAVDMVVGEFLRAKLSTGGLVASAILDSDAVKQISLGDTTVTFDDSASPTTQLMMLIEHLTNGYNSEFATYRQLRW
jgi:hypothetical protein